MSTQQFEKFNDIVKNIQKPLQDIVELNVKTLQSLSFLQPDDFSAVKKPEDLIEKQMKLAIDNGHKALDYMQKSFEIMEKALVGLAKEGKKVSAEVRK